MTMSRIRGFGSLVVFAVVLLVGATAFAQSFPLSGKLTNRRGKATNVPNVGTTPCSPLTFMSGPGIAGTMTPATRFTNIANAKPFGDGGCVGAKSGVSATGSNADMVGGAFQLPFPAFSKPLPPYLQAVSITNTAMGVQIATSNLVTGPPPARFETPGGTKATGCTGTGATLMCANHAAFGQFRTGAWSTQTGRAQPAFTWCPPAIPGPGGGGACTKIGQGGFKGIVKYNGTANGFGGTMSYVTHAGPNPGSLAVTIGGGAVAIVPIGDGMDNSHPSGRGYADFHSDVLGGGPIYAFYATMFVYQGPVLGSQKIITSLGPMIGALVGGTNFNWGFPWTTRTVLVRNSGTVGGLPHNTTFSAAGGDTISMGNRNITLVAGAIGAANQPGVGVVPTSSLTNLLLSLPEPGGHSGLLAGAIALFGIAAWRRRATR